MTQPQEKLRENALMPFYQRLPVSLVKGEGVWLFDDAGNRYLDAISGIGVTNLGHSHPEITHAICEQAGVLLHTSNSYQIPMQAELAERLVMLSGMQQVFFCNSGTETCEAALKLTRLYARSRNVKRPVVLVMKNAFHGRTLGAVSAAGTARAKEDYTPLLPGFKTLPYGSVGALERVARSQIADSVVAVMLEPVQGEGGVRIPPAEYLEQVSHICRSRQWLLLLDEVQSGMCRTGAWFACQHTGVVPDIMLLAKALGNGIPIGACLVNQKVAELAKIGAHGSTFGGNPFACRVGLAVVKTMQHDALPQRAAHLGEIILDRLSGELHRVPGVREVRGHGLMIGIELARECKAIAIKALEHRLLLNVTKDSVVRLLPPIILTDEEALTIATKTARVIREFLQEA